MEGTGDKIKGAATEAMGKIKKGVGDMTDSTKLEAEGLADQAKGKAMKAKGELKDKVDDLTDDDK